MRNIETVAERMSQLGISMAFVQEIQDEQFRIKSRTVHATVEALQKLITTLKKKLENFSPSEIENEKMLSQLQIYYNGLEAIYKKFKNNEPQTR